MTNNTLTQSKTAYYANANMLNQYLFFHYGKDIDLMPFSIELKHTLHFPVRCITECLNASILPSHARALDLGCAVGRSCFELTKHCEYVLGIDNSPLFINAAKQIQQHGQLEYSILEEGARFSKRIAKLPDNSIPNHVEFRCSDVMNLAQNEINKPFDVVVAANILCRLEDPKKFLNMLPTWVSHKGQLILISPYSWLEEFTPRTKWLDAGGNKTPLEMISESLKPFFDLERSFDLPFVMREHLRKYQLVIAQASIWIRK